MAVSALEQAWRVYEQRVRAVNGAEIVSWQIQVAVDEGWRTLTTLYDPAVAEHIVMLHNAQLTSPAWGGVGTVIFP